MNRIDRVTAILIQLQSKRVVKAQEIADRFNISLRTVYRDIKTLDESGIPIIGEAGIGYSIMEGYRLPPVMFTREEAIALLTAGKLVEKFTDGSTQQTHEAAMFKIKSVLRLTERDHIETLEQYIEVIDSPRFSGTKTETAYLQNILKAIGEKLVLNIDYFAEHSQEKTNRNIEPVGIFLMGRYWYLIAYCQLRKDYRTFKIDHIKYLSVTAIPFEAAHPTLQSFLCRVSEEKDLHTIVIHVEKTVLKWLGEQKYYHGFVSQEEMANGDYELRFLTSSLEGFARWYLLYGEQARIIQPAKLVDTARKHIAALSDKLSHGS
jgi:predicted DNA-binding transcriptional regulator YafY